MLSTVQKLKKKPYVKKKGYNTGDRGQVWNARLDPSKVFVNRSDIFFPMGTCFPSRTKDTFGTQVTPPQWSNSHLQNMKGDTQ